MKSMKQCMNRHIFMHSLFGLGVGLILTDIWPGLAKWWLGLILLILSFGLHPMPKDR
jgi:predicted Na+-dependent transporter